LWRGHTEKRCCFDIARLKVTEGAAIRFGLQRVTILTAATTLLLQRAMDGDRPAKGADPALESIAAIRLFEALPEA